MTPSSLVAVAAAALLTFTGVGAQTAATPPQAPQPRQAPFDPPVLQTPWGQTIVPNLDNYVDIQTWRQLKPSQGWHEGAALSRRLRDEFLAGRLDLERYPFRVAEGVYVLGHQHFEQLSYLIDTGAGLLLIDPSLDRWHDELLAQVRLLGFEPTAVKWVALTHAHIDHGQSVHRWRALGAQLLVGEGDAHAVETCNRIVAIWVEPQADGRCMPTPVDRRVHDADVLPLGQLTLNAIAVPGHTPGSMAFHFERGGRQVLVSGDVALHNGRHAWMGNPYANWRQYLSVLDKLDTFSLDGRPVRFDLLLPGHGSIDLDQAWRSVQETRRLVRTIVARRESGERIEWVEPYRWQWEQGRSTD